MRARPPTPRLGPPFPFPIRYASPQAVQPSVCPEGESRRKQPRFLLFRSRSATPLSRRLFPSLSLRRFAPLNTPTLHPIMASTTVYVGNVEATVDEFTLKSIFENCGAVVGVRLAG